MKDIITAVGCDTPVLDIVTPKFELLESVFGKDSISIKHVRNNYEKLSEIIYKGRKTGDKYTGTEDQYMLSKPVINDLDNILKGTGVKLYQGGGTVLNKLKALFNLMDGKLKATNYGSYGKDEAGETLLDLIADTGVRIENFSEHQQKTRINIAFTPIGENDRVIYKRPYEAAKFFSNHNFQIEICSEKDLCLMEASQIQFLGAEKMAKVQQKVLKSGTLCPFSPPTDSKFILDGHQLKKDNIRCYGQLYRNSTAVSMNELEAIAAAGNPRFAGEIENRNDPKFRRAIKILQEALQKDDCVDKHVLITAGKHGLVIISKEHIVERDAPKVEVMSKTGVGDHGAAALIKVACIDNKKVSLQSMEDAADLVTRTCAVKLQSTLTHIPLEDFQLAMKGQTRSNGDVNTINPPVIENTINI